ncbi:Pro-resilin [Amphibalanus amphitrite]|uniref:Pro-resilin n=1 Tax=Amphibalanus amphitrite TaxID=1232801 RepID=A0A6A4VJJ3_AMPAM|nr:Pro-resilin [Amphibalanus amphitrite]
MKLLLVLAVLGLATARPEERGYGSQPASGYGAPPEQEGAASGQQPSVQTAYSTPDGAASGPEGNVAELPASYNFEYAVQDESGNNFGQQETRDGDATSGSYYVQMADGRMQIVNYSVEGDSGYVVDIQASRYEGEANIDAAASGQEGNVATPNQSYGL